MTKQEAIELIDNKDTLVNSDEQDAKIIIREALEKQIPKEPNDVYGKDVIDWTCSRCGRFHRNDYKLKYCSECGQAVKWK